VVRDELGADPEKLFLDWSPEPIAAASIGQVHRAVMPDGRLVAVKVQYPGVDKAIKSDLDNAELLYNLFSAVALKNMDVKAMVDELRARMGDELDYRLEAKWQADFAARYRDHPFIYVPDVVPERSGRRVITSEWVEGDTWADFLEHASADQRERAGEILFRFAEGSIWRHGVFNGDPHPGNYRFRKDGRVGFLDFGLVKRWGPGELESLSPILDAVLAKDVEATVKLMERAGFLSAGHGVDHERIYEYVSLPYLPFQGGEFTYSPDFVASTIQRMIDLNGYFGEVLRALNMPPSYVILDRVVWGMSALLGRLAARAEWGELLDEYRHGQPPTTALGREEAEWRAIRARDPGPSR
jgi:predicted unusual protein kinase regulating ubiquinone biosynthesis (AarF/ABC1/UbiB family)